MSDDFYDDHVGSYYDNEQEMCVEPFQNPISLFGDDQDVPDDYMDDFYDEKILCPTARTRSSSIYPQPVYRGSAYNIPNFGPNLELSDVKNRVLTERGQKVTLPAARCTDLDGEKENDPSPDEHIDPKPRSEYFYRSLDEEFSHRDHRRIRNASGMRLRPVSDLPDLYRSIFKFGVFNAVQSTCFEEVVMGNMNLVISAPTGSGKTVLFELGIIRMLDQNKVGTKPVKCVYVAPTKALCSERFQDWVTKFEPMGIKCCEMTGDTVVFGNNPWGDAKAATLIVTTCEKWDSLTRNWHEHDTVLSQVQLFLVDEVHVLNESRGSTLEVVTSRMKLRSSSIRFILVSATVPNIQDVAHWIGHGLLKSEPARVFEFGDDYRPCQLIRHVVGIPRRSGWNDFQFAKVLDSRLFSVLQEFSVGKPILVFCSTRKGVFETAERLKQDFSENEQKKSSLPWSHPTRVDHLFQDKRLNDLAAVGIGVHHAGISMEDRKATEQFYTKKVLRILVATSTLAVGVNLPAHMVVIKGVRIYQNSESKEYSDLEVMQMLGRAGRPQFDKDGIAVILCESDLEHKYKSLTQGKTVLESSLHVNLAEHLNSEICLGTVAHVDSAKTWLRSSFLYQRMQKNPKYYAMEPMQSQQSAEVVDDVIMESISQLKKSQLIDHVEYGHEVGKLTVTQYGEIMSKYYIRRETVKNAFYKSVCGIDDNHKMDLILALPGRASLKDIFQAICGAEEFQDVKLRASEKKIYNALKNDADIRFALKKIEKTQDKVFLLAQAILGGINLNAPEYKSADSQPHMEAFTVFKHIARISRAALDVATVKKDGLQIKNSLELFRSLSAKAWEDRAIIFRQIEQIGEKSIKVLAAHGITSFQTLSNQSPLKLETLLNRRSPFGMELLASVADLPRYDLRIEEKILRTDGGKNPVQVELIIRCGLVEDKKFVSKTKKQRGRGIQMTSILTLTSDMDLIDIRRIPTKALKGGKSFEVTTALCKPSQSVTVLIASETIAGVAKQETYKPNVSANEYPTMDTRPVSSVASEMDLAGLEDDPDFWNMNLDGSDEIPKNDTEVFNGKKDDGGINKNTVLKDNVLQPRLRSDGRHECNHTCKDKTKCQHPCCNKGLSGPSQHSKRKKFNSTESNSKMMSRTMNPHLSSALRKEKKVLDQLDRMHEQARVPGEFGQLLGDSNRLKLESPRPTKRKRGLPTEYHVTFTDLSSANSNPQIDVPEVFSDSDDLPEVVLPNETASEKSKNEQESLGRTSRCSKFDSTSGRPTKSFNHDKRRGKEVPVLKTQKKDSLFLEISDSEGSIEISSPSRVEEQESIVDVSRRTESRYENLAIEDASPVLFPMNELKRTQGEKMNPCEDEFAELDAWLESGEVEIV